MSTVELQLLLFTLPIDLLTNDVCMSNLIFVFFYLSQTPGPYSR